MVPGQVYIGVEYDYEYEAKDRKIVMKQGEKYILVKKTNDGWCKNTCTAANLLRHKAMIEAKNKDSLTPLLLALKENNQQMAEFLVDMGASIHATDHHGRTSLMLAAGQKSKGTVRLLLQKGVDVFLKEHSGRTALSYAVNCSDNLKEIAVAYEEKQCEMFQNKYPAEVLAGKTSEEEQARLDVCEVNELKGKNRYGQ
ncbi:POTE ankyrin domain family member B [Sciurus carolinensis]|uniref:POTE ankyrin domain family member B n=1 Tax=Sciurus carolinensis TaxID=30640 RepID=A0AA41NA39_SCICA|nr:POTE ankyrin domain family member B [Sciurus carolinensis]